MGIDIRRQGVLVAGHRALEVLFAFLTDASSLGHFSRKIGFFGVPRLVPSVPFSTWTTGLVQQICTSTREGKVWKGELKPDQDFPSSRFTAKVVLLDRTKLVYLVNVFPINEPGSRSLENRLVKAFRLPRAIVGASVEALLPVDNGSFRLDLATMRNRLASVAPPMRKARAGALAIGVMSQKSPWSLCHSKKRVYQLEIVAAGPKSTWQRQGCVVTGDRLSQSVYSPLFGWLNSILYKPKRPTLRLTIKLKTPVWRDYEMAEFNQEIQELANALAL